MIWTWFLVGILVDSVLSTVPSSLPYVRKGKPWAHKHMTSTRRSLRPTHSPIQPKEKKRKTHRYYKDVTLEYDAYDPSILLMEQMSLEPAPLSVSLGNEQGTEFKSSPTKSNTPSSFQKLPLELMGEISSKLGLKDAAHLRSTCKAAYRAEVFPFAEFHSLTDLSDKLRETLVPHPYLNGTLQQQVLHSLGIQLNQDTCSPPILPTTPLSQGQLNRLEQAFYCGAPFTMTQITQDVMRDKVQEVLIQVGWNAQALYWLMSRLEWTRQHYKVQEVLFKWIKTDPARQIEVDKETKRLVLMALGLSARYNNTVLFDRLLQEPFSATPNYYTLNEAFRGGNRHLVHVLMQQYRIRPHKKALVAAATGGHLDMVQFLIEHDFIQGDVDGAVEKAFEAALKSGNIQLVHYFMNPPFHILPRKDLLFAAASSGNVELLRYIAQEWHQPVDHNCLYVAQEYGRKRMLHYVLCKLYSL